MKGTYLVALFTIIAGATSLAGQEVARDTTTLQPIVITATRVSLALSANTAAATIITGEDLRARGISTVAEALRMVPGASIAPSGSFGGTTSFFLRGGERDYVRVLVDGVPINQPGGEIDLANITTDNIERIEVVRGPTSVLYGSDAVSGVIQIFTRRGGTRGLTVSGRAGTYDTREADLSATGGSARAAWSLGASARRTNGILAFNNSHRNDVLSGSLGFQPDARSDVRFTGRFQDGRFNYPTDHTGAPVDTNAFRTERQLVVAVDAGRRFTQSLEARLLLGATESDLRNDDRPDNEQDESGYVSRNEIGRKSAEGRLNIRFAPAAVLSTGFEYSQQRDRNQSTSIFGGEEYPVPLQTPRRFNRALYLQATGDVGQRASYSIGGRYDHNADFGEFGTYRAAGGLRVFGLTFLRAALGTAFKEPTIFENYGGGFVTGNPDLLPERSRSWEVGAEQRMFGGALSVAATWFDQSFRDRIEFAMEDEVATYANLASARARGLELEAHARPHTTLTVAASYTAMSTRATEHDPPGDRLLRRPATLVALAVDYSSVNQASLGAALNRVGDRDDMDFSTWPSKRVRLPAYTKVDLYGEYAIIRARAAGRTFSLTGRVDNLFDEEYQSVFGFRTPGRTLLLGARLALTR